jgi:hypothetical protein
MWFVAAMLVLSALFGSYSSLVAANASRQTESTAMQLQTEIDRRNASECVDSWERSEGAKNSIALAITGVVRAFISVFPNASAEMVGRIESAAAEAIRLAQVQIPDPSCDLETAKRRLNQINGV